MISISKRKLLQQLPLQSQQFCMQHRVILKCVIWDWKGFFFITSPLWGESTSHWWNCDWWNSRQRASSAELWSFLSTDQSVKQTVKLPMIWIWDTLTFMWYHSNELIVAYWRQMATEIWVNIGSGNSLLPDGTKPLHEPMLTNPQWSPVTFILGQFHKRRLNHQSLKSVWKSHV